LRLFGSGLTAHPPGYLRIPDDDAVGIADSSDVLEPGGVYLEVRLSELYVRPRRWQERGHFPSLFGEVNATYGGEPVSLPILATPEPVTERPKIASICRDFIPGARGLGSWLGSS
jgi:hypothetical protein